MTASVWDLVPNPPAFSFFAFWEKAPHLSRWLKALSVPWAGRRKGSLFTFADTKLVTKIILLTVKLTPQPGATLHAIHAWDRAVASFSRASGAHPAAPTVVQHRPLTAQAAFALVSVTTLGAIDRVLGAPGRRQVRADQERGQQQEALHVSRGGSGSASRGGVFAGGKKPSKVVAERLPTRLWVLYTGLPACLLPRHQFPQPSSSAVLLPGSLVLVYEIQDEGWINTLLPSRNWKARADVICYV